MSTGRFVLQVPNDNQTITADGSYYTYYVEMFPGNPISSAYSANVGKIIV